MSVRASYSSIVVATTIADFLGPSTSKLCDFLDRRQIFFINFTDKNDVLAARLIALYI